MAQPVEVTPDGWIVTDTRLFRILTEHAPPRPWGYWDQIRTDLHEPKLVRVCVVGVGCTTAGVGITAAAVVTGYWVLLLGGLPLLLGGLRLLLLWVRLARGVIRGIRTHPLATGVIDALEPHPILPTILAVGRAARSSGELVNVAAELPLAREIERAGTPAEVWFIDDPTFDYRAIFAARPDRPRSPIPARQPTGPAASDSPE